MNTSEIFTKAHKLAKKVMQNSKKGLNSFKGTYAKAFAWGLKKTWESFKDAFTFSKEKLIELNANNHAIIMIKGVAKKAKGLKAALRSRNIILEEGKRYDVYQLIEGVCVKAIFEIERDYKTIEIDEDLNETYGQKMKLIKQIQY